MPKTKSPIVEHAGSGLMVPEPLARHIDELSKGLPSDFTFRRVAKAISDPRFGQLEDGSRTDISTVTTDDIDRDNEIILPGGIDLSDFRKSPTVFYAHDYTKPIGKALWIKAVGNGLDACTKYAKKPDGWQGPWLPDAVLSMMQEGIGCGKSIGLIPLSIRPVTRADLQQRPDWRGAKQIVDKSVMLEFSAAPLPVNQLALATAVSKGLIDKDTASLLAYTLPPDKTLHPNPQMSKYSHIDFKASKEVVKAHKEGLQRHAEGEGKGHATPETLAMARHMAEGGEASPDYVRKVCAYHDQNPNHLSAKPGTPAYCLAMLHGGHSGAAHYKSILCAMDQADATPDASIDSNGVPAAITKAEGAAEGDLASGGAAVPEETKVIDPVTEETKNKAVTEPPAKVEEPAPAAEAAPEPVPAATVVEPTPEPAPVVKAVTQEQINKAVERVIDSRQDQILQKAIQKAQDLAILAMGGV
jgi:hypothetical protein